MQPCTGYYGPRRTRRASKDAIVDTFWPDADFEAVEKNFHPTISHIRKALNSNQVLKLKVLVFRDGHYLLNPELQYSLDTEELDAAVAEADAAPDDGYRSSGKAVSRSMPSAVTR